MKFNIKQNIIFIAIAVSTALSSCEFFKSNEETIEIPEGTTEAQLQENRYKYKRENNYKNKYLHQTKTDSAIITIYDIIQYEMRDDGTSIGDGYTYFIFDISVDNFTNHEFNIGNFTKSCFLSNENPLYLYSNVGFALKMYHLQTDSAQIDMEYTKRFYIDKMPEKELYRTKLFAFEVSNEDKDPLFFHYKVGNQKFEYKVRE